MLTDYQKGSIFGAVLVACAFAFWFATYNEPSKPEVENATTAMASNHSTRESFWHKVRTDPLNSFTLGLMLIGAIQAGLFLWQLKLIRESVTDAEDLARATKETAKATSDSVALSIETAERELRAYVFIDHVNVARVTGPYVHIDVVIKNFGKTPAYKGLVKYETDIRTKIPDDHIFKFTNNVQTYENLTVAPGHDNTIRITRSDLANYTSNSGKYAYLWGRVDYFDAFNKPRITTFQMAYDFGGLTSFGVCYAGNEAT